jgi:hypothetical protein
MQDKARLTLRVLVFVLAFAAAKIGLQTYREHRAVADAAQKLEQLQAQAESRHPGESATLALKKEAAASAATELQRAPNASARERSAADMFWGYYFLNTRSRPEYCRARGVDIHAFVAAFAAANADELRAARAIYRRAGADENDTYRLSASLLDKVLQQDMREAATSNHLSEIEVCQVIEDHADALVARLQLSKAQPTVYATLHAADR